MALTGRALEVFENFDTHAIASASDTRREITEFDREDWEDVLHPGLSFLAESLAHLSKFLKADWSLWKKDDLPEDFMHEVLKRILLREIVHLSSSKDHDIRLRKKERNSGGQLRKPG